MPDDRHSSMSGLSEREAQEFHALFVKSFLAFVAIAAVAHLLVWNWRPWIGPRADAMGSDTLQTFASLFQSLV